MGDPQSLLSESTCYTCFGVSEDEALELALLARTAGSGGGLGAITLSLDSTNTVNGHAVLLWSAPASGADSYEIWRQRSGLNAVLGVVISSPFSLLATVSGVTTYTDPLTLLSDDASGIADYKIRFKKNGVFSPFSNIVGWLKSYTFTLTGPIPTLSLPNLVVITSQLSVTAPLTLKTFSLPSLVTCGTDHDPVTPRLGLTALGLTSLDLSSLIDITNNGGFGLSLSISAIDVVVPKLVHAGGPTSIACPFGCKTFSVPVLATTDGDLDFSTNTDVTSISAPLYTFCGEFLNVNNCSKLTTLSFPALVTIVDQISFWGSPLLSSISFPVLTTITNIGINPFAPANCANLTSASLPVLVYGSGLTFDFSGCGLSASSVNAILHQAVASNPIGSTFSLAGGTNAAPTGQGVIDKAALAVNNTVTTN